MPIYEYQCQTCGKVVEVLQKISEPTPEQAEGCEKRQCKLEKIMSKTSFVLKGSGWYETDFKGKPKEKTPNKDDGKSEKDKKSETDTKDTKPIAENGGKGSETTASKEKAKETSPAKKQASKE